MEASVILFLPILFVVACLYAAVGHGGASGYLALMALFSVEPSEMKLSALTLNVFVSGFAFYHYYRAGHFRFKLFLPFALSSIPMAFVGAGLVVDPDLYKNILGFCLIFAVVRMLSMGNTAWKTRVKRLSWPLAVFVGGVLGFVSGMIGIGGGIILSPVLLLFHWADMKETAAVSALFILTNSCAGILGVWMNGGTLSPQIIHWIFVAVIGGCIGAYLGSRQIKTRALGNLLAGVLLLASLKLLIL